MTGDAWVGASISIRYLDRDVCAKVKTELQWPNPEYAKRENSGRSTWGVPRNIVLWQSVGNNLIVPFGYMRKLYSYGVRLKATEHVFKPSERRFEAEVKGLYGYQEKAVESALKAKNGVLVAPCGSGKTQMGLAICARLGLRTLWLTHTHELLQQSRERAKSVLGLDDSQLGTITGGKINVSDCITFATVQTMSKIDLSQFAEYWDVIIADECQHACGTPTQLTMFWKVLSGLSARYKIGLTATPKRADGMEKAMFALLGEKFYEVSREDVKHTTCPLFVPEPIPTGWEPDFEKCLNPDGTLNYTSLITECVLNKERNQVLARLINEIGEWGATLVLSERVAHLESLAYLCKHPFGILSTTKKSERQNVIQMLKDGEIKVLFATYAIAKEGLDIPCLEHLVMASPIKDETAVTQSAGRVMRAYPNKKAGTLWEFEDNMAMLKKWLKKRQGIYRRLNL